MGTIRALLIGVSDYSKVKLKSLPFCKNDLYAMKDALVHGINTNPDNILICGETGIVTYDDLIDSIRTLVESVTENDTFIFYFTGHGGNNILALSDKFILLQQLLDTIEQVRAKSKIAILDSCRSGDFSLNSIPMMNIGDTVECFAGHGFAVLSSSGAEQDSGFHPDKEISLYTSFVCDALTSRYLIRKGKKSLEAINEAISHFSKMTPNSANVFQRPIFRSSIGGTIYFDVEEYNPYKVEKIYEECDRYIIYDVEPTHVTMTKRLSVKVILRYQSSEEEIARIANEVKDKVLYCEVYQNKSFEEQLTGKAANIIWCYFGYDEDDMVDCNYMCHTTWVDESQDKKWWYRKGKDALIIDGVHLSMHKWYAAVKKLKDKSLNKDELIKRTSEYTRQLISAAERYIKVFREYLNGALTEEQLINFVAPLNTEIAHWYFLQSDLPIPPKELHDWAQIHTRIACTIHDISLFYAGKNLETRTSENRRWLVKNAIEQYEAELEEIKEADKYIGR